MLNRLHIRPACAWLTFTFLAAVATTIAWAQNEPDEIEIVANGGFETGLAPWGQRLDGRQEPVWVVSGNAASTAELDRNSSMSGAGSLHIVNPAKQEGSYGETGQRIRLEPQKKYRLTLWARANNLASDRGLLLAIDGPDSSMPLVWLDAGTYEWTPFSHVFSLNLTDCELRIISLDSGEVWLDDLAIEPE